MAKAGRTAASCSCAQTAHGGRPGSSPELRSGSLGTGETPRRRALSVHRRRTAIRWRRLGTFVTILGITCVLAGCGGGSGDSGSSSGSTGSNGSITANDPCRLTEDEIEKTLMGRTSDDFEASGTKKAAVRSECHYTGTITYDTITKGSYKYQVTTGIIEDPELGKSKLAKMQEDGWDPVIEGVDAAASGNSAVAKLEDGTYVIASFGRVGYAGSGDTEAADILEQYVGTF